MSEFNRKETLALLAANQDFVQLACQRQRLTHQISTATKKQIPNIFAEIEYIDNLLEEYQVNPN